MLITSRTTVVGALVAIAALLAACGGNDSSAASDTSANDTTPSSTSAIVDTAPRQVTNEFGTFDVPADPQRLVVLEGRRDFETALALGLSPVAVGDNAQSTDGDALAEFLDFDMAGVTVLDGAEVNLEAVAALDPDLILGRVTNIADVAEGLTALAPVLPVGDSGPWRADLEHVAAWLGREDQVGATLNAYDDYIAELRSEHADSLATATVAVVTYIGGQEFAAGSFFLQTNTLDELGGTQLPYLTELREDSPYGPPGAFAKFSVEHLDELAAADGILLIVNGQDRYDELASLELWKQLPAVQAGNVVRTDSRTNYGSVYAATACLELLDQLYTSL